VNAPARPRTGDSRIKAEIMGAIKEFAERHHVFVGGSSLNAIHLRIYYTPVMGRYLEEIQLLLRAYHKDWLYKIGAESNNNETWSVRISIKKRQP
jgi:hypothetical protein